MSKTAQFLSIAALGILVVLFVLIFRAAPSPPALPKPNGYEDFIKAGQMLAGDVSKFRELSMEELRATLSNNDEALKLVRLGLSRECAMTTEFTEAYAGAHLAEMSGFKSLARLLAAEGRLAELDNQPPEAAHSYLDTVRLGQEISRGGLIIDKLVGIACEAIGLNALSLLKDKLSAQQCRDVTRALESIDSKAERVEKVLEQEHSWSRKTFGWRGQVIRLIRPQMLKQPEQRFIQKAHGADQQRRRLLIELAISACEREKGARPKTLSELVPSYLKAIPVDPFTGTNMTQ